ncbi:hypothetical protein pb186bvf_005299 [Paramecium bursaria]
MLLLILLIVYSAKQKLIASNTFDSFNQIFLKEDDNILVVWFQVRFKITKLFSNDYKKLPIFRIADRFDNEQVNANLELYPSHLNMIFTLQNEFNQTHLIIIDEKLEIYWIMFQVNKNTCFNQIIGPKNFIFEAECKQSYDQILYLNQIQIYQILFYDKKIELNELENLYKEIYNFPLQKEYYYSINGQRNEIQILAYVKFINITNIQTPIFKLLNNDFNLVISSSGTNLIIQFEKYDIQDLIFISEIDSVIVKQQWFLIDVSFNGTQIIYKFHKNEQTIQEIVSTQQFQIYLSQLQMSTYSFQQIFQIINNNTLYDKIMLINNLNQREKVELDFCYTGCKNCNQFQCLDKIIINCSIEQFYNISIQKCQNIIDSNVYTKLETQNILCDENYYLYENKICKKCPQYQGYNYTFCNYKNNRKQELLIENMCLFKQITFHEIMLSVMNEQQIPYQIYDVRFIRSCSLHYEKDLNIYLHKYQDPFLVYRYKTSDINYCELGYHYKKYCKINIKNCLFQNQNKCKLCKQKYSLVNNKCIKCQLNCQFCQILNKKVQCILFKSNYQANQNELIKQCKDNSNIICQNEVELIQDLQIQGYEVCQYHQIYQIQNQRCVEINQFSLLHDISEIRNMPIIADSKLEIQNMLLFTTMNVSQSMKQLNLLINYQQMLKLSNLSHKINNKYDQYFIQTQDQNQKYKLILDDIQIYLSMTPIIITYQGQAYQNILQIYDEKIQNEFEWVIQFNIQIIILFQKDSYNNVDFESMIQYENTKMIFIYNLTFLQSPKIMLQGCFQIKLKANEIIFNGFDVYDLDLNNCNSQCGIYLFADIIKLENFNFYKSDLAELFYFYDFEQLHIQNIYFKDSQIFKFMTALTYSSKICHYINIEHIILNNCIIHEFIKVLNVENLEFINFTIINSTLLQSKLFFITGNKNLLIRNLQIIQVNILNAILFQFQSRIIKLQQIQVVQSTITNSTIFLIISQMHEIRNIFFNQIQIEFSEIFKLYGSYLFLTDINLKLPSVYFSSMFKLEFEQNIQFRNIYIQITNISLSLIMDSLSDNFYVRNLNILSQQLIKTKFLYINCENAELEHILIGEYKQMIYEQIQFLINLRSNSQLGISDINFFNLLSKDSGLIQLLSNQLIQVTNMSIINSTIDIKYLQELIQIRICKQSIIQNIHLKNLVIQSQEKVFSIVFLFGRDYNHQTNISKFHASMIQSYGNLILIQNEFSQINLKRIQLSKLKNVNFIISNSTYFTLQNCQFTNITNSNKDFALIIIQIQQWNTLIKIFNISINHVEGQLISIIINQDSDIYLNDFNIQDSCIQQDTVFSIQQSSDNKSKLSRLKISKISYINHYNLNNQLNVQYMFKVKFYNVVFEHIKIINSRLQFLLLENNFHLLVNNFYIQNFTSQNAIVEIANSNTQQLQFNYYIQIINFTATNSLIILKSIFKMRLLKNQNIMMRNVKLFDIQVKDTFVILNDFQHLFINFDRIIVNHIQLGQSFVLSQGSKICLENTYLLNSQMQLIFNNSQGKINIKNAFIIGFQLKSDFVKSQSTSVRSSEIVDSNIFSQGQQIQLINSQFESGSNQNLIIYKFNEERKQFLFLSLNEGQSYFEQQQVQNNVFQVCFSKDNNYLFLPSGRNIRFYKYFNIKKQRQEQIYSSISIINKYYQNNLDCLLQQTIDEIIIWSQQIQLKTENNILQNITFTLNPLEKDKHIQFDVICSQNEGNLTLRTLVKTFNCQLGEYLFQNQCLQCDIERQYYSIGYNQKFCEINFQDKIQELKVGKIKLYPNYWRYSITNKYIELCDNQNCLGGWQTGDKSCKIGYIGATCIECDLNNIRGNGNYGKINDTCQLCYFDNQIYLKGFGLIVWQLLLVYMSYYSTKQQSQQHLFFKISQRKFKEILISLNINQVTILIQLIWDYVFTIYLLKDVISYGYKIDVSLNFIYNPNLTTIPQQDCLIKDKTNFSIQYTQLLVKTIFPVFVFNIFVTIYVISIKMTAKRFRIYVIIVSLISIYQQNQLIILQSLLKLSSKVKYSNIWWTLECVTIQFYSKQHQYYLFSIILPLIALFFVCNIIACFWISYVHRKRLSYTQLSIFIYFQYKTSIYYWNYFKYTFIYLFMVFLYLLHDQKQMIIIITLIVLIINSKQRPFILKNLNEIDQVICQFSIFSYFSTLVIQKENKQMSLIILIFSNFTLIYFFIKQFVFSWNIQYKRSFIQIIQRIQNKVPLFKQVISLDKYLKTQYYYSLLRSERKKSDCNFSSIIQTQSSYQKPANSCEIELIRLQQLREI